ncbi:hypothetical protein RQP46_007332 [Phenoliferia psychrophenolica]
MNVFGFFLSRAGASGSTLTIGALDSSHYTGPIQYTPVTQQTYWKVSAGSAVSGKAVGSSYNAAIDTGTTLIYLPTAVAATVYAAIPGASKSTAYSSSGSDVYTYPCSSSATVQFTFGGLSTQFAVDSRDFNLGYATIDYQTCVGGIIGSTFSDGNPLAIIEFLKSWYSVIEDDNYAQRGTKGDHHQCSPKAFHHELEGEWRQREERVRRHDVAGRIVLQDVGAHNHEDDHHSGLPTVAEMCGTLLHHFL